MTPARAVTLGIVMLTASRIPVFLVGTSSVQMLDNLGDSSIALGTALAAFFGVAGCVSIGGGAVVARRGSAPGLRWGPVLTLISLIGVAGLANSWLTVTLWLMIGGVATAIVEPAINQTLSEYVPRERQGVAFALKQSANPLAVLIGSLVVPLITLHFGWRFSFWSASVLSLLAMVTAKGMRRALPATVPRPDGALVGRRRAIAFGLLGACGAVVGNAAGGFSAVAMSAAGVGAATIGVLMTVCSLGAIVVRVQSGAIADRHHRTTGPLIGLLLVVGVLGCALVATGLRIAVVVGVFAVFFGGWGWPGLLHLQLVRQFGRHTGIATGVMLAGVAAGSAGGPLFFGWTNSAFGAPAAWLATAAVGCTGFLLNRQIGQRPATDPAIALPR